MNELIEKLRAILTELGVEEDKIEAAVTALSEETAPVDPEGESVEESTSSEAPVEEEGQSGEPEVEGEEEVEPLPEEVVPAEAESVPEALEEPQPEQVPSVEEAVEPEVVPEAPIPPMEPSVSLEEFQQVVSDLTEMKKANEGLAAQVASLKEALQAAGVINGSLDDSVGIDEPSAPSGSNVDTTMDDVLREINHKGY